MRLPMPDEDTTQRGEAQSIKIIRYAIDHGVNYLDLGPLYYTRYPERLLRLVSQALQDDYRKKIRIAVSIPSFLIKSFRDLDYHLNSHLKLLQTDRIDFQLWGELDRESWPKLQQLNVLRWAEGALSDRRIDHLGFSFHDDYQVLRNILNSYDNWSLGQFPYSFLDIKRSPGFGGIRYAAQKGLAIVIAEPIRRGRSAKDLPESIAKMWETSFDKKSLSSWTLRWAWNRPEVSTVVCDIPTMEEAVEGIALAESAEADCFSVKDQVLLSQIGEACHKLRPIPCTACFACMPCPEGIHIPRIFELYNDAMVYGDAETMYQIYRMEQHDIETCNECGECMNACGKKIIILNWLKAAHRLFGI